MKITYLGEKKGVSVAGVECPPGKAVAVPDANALKIQASENPLFEVSGKPGKPFTPPKSKADDSGLDEETRTRIKDGVAALLEDEEFSRSKTGKLDLKAVNASLAEAELPEITAAMRDELVAEIEADE